MAESRGIEIFGRGATIVETGVDVPRRGPWPGVLALLLGVGAAACTAMGVVSAADDAVELARWLAYAGIAASILGAGIGFLAVATGRGVTAGLWGMVIAVVGNPWVLTRILEAAAALLR
jgi:hypothetical protein